MTRQIKVGDVLIGGSAPIAIQSMSTFSPADTEYAAAQINALDEAGADIVRLAVPDKKAAEALGVLRAKVKVPLVADIHFDYRLALTAMESGIDALRINPGNIGKRENVIKVVTMAKEKNIPIRIGINAGSLPEYILEEYGGHPTAEGMVAGALEHVRILENENFHNIVISVKSTDVPMMVKANRMLHDKVDYPLHLGVTQVNLIEMAQEVEKRLEKFKKPVRVAVMGCAVNGPGEAREADFGIAGGKGAGLLFRKGKVIRSVPETELIDALMEEIEKYENEGE